MDQSVERVFSKLPAGDFWVFGYGSLMWNPGFVFEEKQSATLAGFKRSLCVWSWHHRGTRHSPGLVFGLDKVSASEFCHGCAYHVAEKNRAEALAYLMERELITDIYKAASLPVIIGDREELALTFIVDTASEQYAGRIDAAECAAIIANAQGRSGLNSEYVLETWRYLQEHNIPDRHLQAISTLLERRV